MPACSSDDGVRDISHAEAAHPTQPDPTEKDTPFPLLPMVAISLCLVTVAYSICNLFPYAGYMVQHLGVTDDKDEAGKLAGVTHDQANFRTPKILSILQHLHLIPLSRCLYEHTSCNQEISAHISGTAVRRH